MKADEQIQWVVVETLSSRSLAGLLILAPTIALAQPGATPPLDAPLAPPDPNAPRLAPPSATPAMAPGGAALSDRRRTGLTFEANLGFGVLWANSDDGDLDSETGLGGLDLGLGGWLSDRLALTGRIAGATVFVEDSQFSLVSVGPSLQYWTNDHFWIGGGLGLAVFAARIDDEGDETFGNRKGFALDLRAGYTFSTASDHTFNVSVELTPTWFGSNNDEFNLNTFAVLLGYQHL